jgi:hypothetical protein
VRKGKLSRKREREEMKKWGEDRKEKKRRRKTI